MHAPFFGKKDGKKKFGKKVSKKKYHKKVGLMTEQKPYTGPVVYITHSPMPKITYNEDQTPNSPFPQKETEQYNRLSETHEKAIARVLKFAEKHGLPVVYEREFLVEDAKELVREAGVKQPIFISNKSKAKIALGKMKIQPTKFICVGIYQDVCVSKSVEQLKKFFPQTPITIVGGKYSPKILLADKERQAKARAFYRANGIEIRKKLGPHLIGKPSKALWKAEKRRMRLRG